MTDKEAIERFEQTYEQPHSVKEQFDMIQDIEKIRNVLSKTPVVISQVREQIDTVNRKHPENIIIFNLIFPPQGNRVSLVSASDDNLISDLTWKLDYLQAKQMGKAFEEFCKTKRDASQRKIRTEDKNDGKNENGVG